MGGNLTSSIFIIVFYTFSLTLFCTVYNFDAPVNQQIHLADTPHRYIIFFQKFEKIKDIRQFLCNFIILKSNKMI